MATLLSSETLSYNSSPGQDKLYQSTNTDSIFTFGDFRITRSLNPNILNNDPRFLSFDGFQTLSGLTSGDFDAERVLYIQENDLNPDVTNPNSYSYYGSYYTRVARAINNIIEKFPYAILAYDFNTGNTNFIQSIDYQSSQTEIWLVSSAFTNQANYVYTSGYTFDSLSSTTANLNLFNNYNQFEIQLSSSTMNTSPSYPILSYSYSAQNSSYLLYFRLAGVLTANTTDAIYIRPTKKRYFQYKRTLSNLEYQLLEKGQFSVPSTEDQFYMTTFTWPRLIDGFAPDSEGLTFEAYVDQILRWAKMTDRLKTNWMIRTIIPENYLELDDDGAIYQKLIQVYGEEFDQIKAYIDNLAYAHTVNYSNNETVPDKLLYKLSNLLGWSQPINFTDTDFFEFLALEDDNNKSLDDYNLELWRRILVNLNWLYKKKGTRDAVMFIFKIIGAPACLINFNEFVYKVKQSTLNQNDSTQAVGFASLFPNFNDNTIGYVNSKGYPNYQDTTLKFQGAGPGRGNGDDYINEFRTNFDPIRTVDNIKSYTGNPEVFGTMDTMNSKEIDIGLDPAAAIECDVFAWYQAGMFYTGNTSVSLPDEYKISGISPNLIAPPQISGWTISEWLDFVYKNTISVRTRKTDYQPLHSYFYPNLRKLYLTYYYWNVPNQISSKVTFRMLENFLKLIENKLETYLYQLIPATTIFDGISTIYRNTLFNRQKFVYPVGINVGSEFQTYTPQFFTNINGAVVTSKVNDIFKGTILANTVTGYTKPSINLNLQNVTTTAGVPKIFSPVINAFSTNLNVLSANTLVNPVIQPLYGGIINFPVYSQQILAIQQQIDALSITLPKIIDPVAIQLIQDQIDALQMQIDMLLRYIPYGLPPGTPVKYTGNTASGGLGPIPVTPSQA